MTVPVPRDEGHWVGVISEWVRSPGSPSWLGVWGLWAVERGQPRQGAPIPMICPRGGPSSPPPPAPPPDPPPPGQHPFAHGIPQNSITRHRPRSVSQDVAPAFTSREIRASICPGPELAHLREGTCLGPLQRAGLWFQPGPLSPGASSTWAHLPLPAVNSLSQLKQPFWVDWD